MPRPLLYCLLALATAWPAAASFRNDVMAVISTAGCNLGTCHGNANGKGGFKLSLRGQDPAEDFAALTKALAGRRINLMEPAKSLILLKATAEVAHLGGKRFGRDTELYATLKTWIAQGGESDLATAPALTALMVTPLAKVLIQPEQSIRLAATAHFADGSQREVTRLAVYEPSNTLAAVSSDGLVSSTQAGETTVMVRFLSQQVPVRLAFVPARPDFIAEAPTEQNFIDRHIFAKLRSLRMNPSPPCDDTAFVRRVYLDLLGRIPTSQEAKQFVQASQPDKRPKLMDALLEEPEFADFWALKWADLLHVDERPLDRKGVRAFHHWLRQGIAEHKPVDQFARELVSASGSTYAHPAAGFYRALRTPQERAEAAALVFLGTRLQCAQCHNHPFDRWSQDEYYEWAALFARVNYKVLENRRRDDNDGHEFVGEQLVFTSKKGAMENPRTGKAAVPRLLGAGQIVGQEAAAQLAAWLTSPENPRFARAQVNRVWYHLMGRGLVDPVDDFRDTNIASHPELLDALAEEFIRSGFDLRRVIRLIAGSRAYQLSAVPNASNAEDEANYSHAIPRRLSAEQLADSWSVATGVSAKISGYPEGTRAAQIAGVKAVRERRGRDGAAEKFLTLFGKPPRLMASETERSGDSTMGQAFDLLNGAMIRQWLGDKQSLHQRLLDRRAAPEEMVDELCWAALSRPPSAEERAQLAAYLAESGQDRLQAAEDIFWSLLNAKEFVLRY